jgi:D-arabinitol dehydrogenase (NADP+)
MGCTNTISPQIAESAEFVHPTRCQVGEAGLGHKEATIPISPYDIYRKDLTIYGSFSLRYTFHEAIAFIRAGVLDVTSLISDRFPIEAFPAALELAGSGQAFKVQIQPAA